MPEPQPGDTLPADAIEAAVDEARQDCAAAIMFRLDEIPQREIMRISAEAGLRIGLRLGRAQGAAAERARIYAPDNFPGDGSVGPDDIPDGYRHLDAAYWHRRWLWMMNRLDEAPTAWDVHAAREDGAAAERERIRQGSGRMPGENWYDVPADLLDGGTG